MFRDEEGDETANQAIQQGDGPAISDTGNPFLDVPNVTGATEFKKGYVMRKCCFDSNGKKSIYFMILLIFNLLHIDLITIIYNYYLHYYYNYLNYN